MLCSTLHMLSGTRLRVGWITGCNKKRTIAIICKPPPFTLVRKLFFMIVKASRLSAHDSSHTAHSCVVFLNLFSDGIINPCVRWFFHELRFSCLHVFLRSAGSSAPLCLPTPAPFGSLGGKDLQGGGHMATHVVLLVCSNHLTLAVVP